MYLATLSLHNFKNFAEAEIQFDKGTTCITGANGSGKTNLLDAIYYLSLGKSAFNSIDAQNIRHGESFFSITGSLEVDEEEVSIQCALKKGMKKNLRVNNLEYSKLSEHVGKYPLVLIAPDDSDLVREHSDARRRFIDSILSQSSAEYFENLLKYNNFLKQRNAALKSLSEKRKKDETLIAAYDDQLIPLNEYLYDQRNMFTEKFTPYIERFYSDISEDREKIKLSYKSGVAKKTFGSDFRSNIERDLLLQRTELGIHRDDFIFKINSHGLKKFGSQGQQKSFIISLKLAQYEFLKEEKEIEPILLLDDIFDKLDENRIEMLMKLVNSGRFGQIFITDARAERTRDIVKKNKIPASFRCIQDNSIKPC